MRSDTRRQADAAISSSRIQVPFLERMNPRQFWGFLAVGTLMLIGFFILTSPAVRTGSDDTYWFAFHIEQTAVSETMSAREVLFIPLMKVVFFAARGLGLTDRAFDAISVASAVLAAGAVLVQVLILNRRFSLSRTASLLGGLLLVVGFGFWRFASEVEVYPLGLLAALGLLYIALGNPRRWQLWAGIGALGALAFLIHGLTAMVSLVAIPVLLIAGAHWRRLIAYVAVLVPLVFVGTFAAYQVADAPDMSYWDFYSSASSSQLGASPNLVARGGIGAGQSIISSGFLFAYGGFEEFVTKTAPERAIADERFVAARVGDVQLVAMSVTFLLSFLLVAAAIAFAVPGVFARRKEAGVLAVVAWLAALTLFQVSRAGGSDGPESWLFAAPALAMLITIGLTATPRRSTLAGAPILVVLIVVLALHNAMGMALLSNPEGDRNAAKAAWLIENTQEGDVVLIADSSIFLRYVRYESAADVIFLTEEALAGNDVVVVSNQAATDYDRVFLTSDVLVVPDTVRHRNQDAYDRLRSLAEDLEQVSVLVISDEFGGVYRLQTP